jgi:hypothetical protein
MSRSKKSSAGHALLVHEVRDKVAIFILIQASAGFVEVVGNDGNP